MLNIKFCLCQSIDHYDADPSSQGTFCSSHKITVIISPVGFNQDLSTLDIYKAISQVSSQTKQVKKLHMPIKHINKSLAGYKQKKILVCQLFFNHNTNEKTKITLFYVHFVC